MKTDKEKLEKPIINKIFYKKTKVFGVGDLDGHKTNNKAYTIWYQILKRCYSYDYNKKTKAYKDCIVCDEWLHFPTFKKWYDKNFKKGCDLDKDLLGENLYSPKTCCFIPPQLNTVLITGKGISKSGNKFRVRISKKGKDVSLGSFNTKFEALMKYKYEKKLEINRVAKSFFDRKIIDENIYKSFLNYEVKV